MKRFLMGMVMAASALTVQAGSSSGTIEEVLDGGSTLRMSGKLYHLDKLVTVATDTPAGKSVPISQDDLKAGDWVEYSVSTQTGHVGNITAIEVVGPADRLQKLQHQGS